MSGSEKKSYRPEIDGLRAVAVLPVVLYHFGVPGLGGGFVGVDIFFVISGFLIGGILWSELDRTGRIRLGAFFARRIRRLATAYLAMAFVTLIFAWFVLLPFDFREFGQELVAATVYLANVHYFNSAGYFDQGSDQKLLLHTWSLAVEEQFYVVLPLLMLALTRWRAALPALLAGLAVVSLLTCLLMMQISPSAAFYLLPFRAWELLAGVCLAILGHRRQLSWQVHPGLSWAGIALTAVAVLFFEAGSHFPGLYALVPVLGALLIIANGQDDNPVNRVLCSRAALFFGLISYSLYLWHWPLVTLLRYYQGGTDLSVWQIPLLFSITIAVSWLSWRFIETPVRHGALAGWRLVAGYAVTAAALTGTALSFAFSDGWPGRFPDVTHPFLTATRDFNQNWSRCRRPDAGPWAGLEICPIGPVGSPTVLVWGDSHARAFKEGLERAAFEAKRPGLLIWRAGCPPLLGLLKQEKVSNPEQDAACAVSAERVQRALASVSSIDTLMLLGRWSYYAEGTGVGADARNWVALQGLPDGPLAGIADQKELFSAALSLTVDELLPSVDQIFVLRQVPEIFDYTARKAAQALVNGKTDIETLENTLAQVPRASLEARFSTSDIAIAALDRRPGVDVVDLWQDLCTEGACSAFLNGEPIYFDNNHITNSGALALRHRFRPVFEER